MFLMAFLFIISYIWASALIFHLVIELVSVHGKCCLECPPLKAEGITSATMQTSIFAMFGIQFMGFRNMGGKFYYGIKRGKQSLEKR